MVIFGDCFRAGNGSKCPLLIPALDPHLVQTPHALCTPPQSLWAVCVCPDVITALFPPLPHCCLSPKGRDLWRQMRFECSKVSLCLLSVCESLHFFPSAAGGTFSDDDRGHWSLSVVMSLGVMLLLSLLRQGFVYLNISLNYAAADNLEHLNFLPPRLMCWNYIWKPPHIIYVIYALLEIKPRALCMLGKLSPNWATSPAQHIETFKEQITSMYESSWVKFTNKIMKEARYKMLCTIQFYKYEDQNLIWKPRQKKMNLKRTFWSDGNVL